MAPPQWCLDRFDLTATTLVADTAIAQVWRGRQRDRDVALKLYKPKARAGEAAGIKALKAWNGRSAAQLLASDGDAILLEWLDGPTLGDLSRKGQDQEATVRLTKVAMSLWSLEVPPPPISRSLEETGAALLNLDLSRISDLDLACDLAAAQNLARRLFTQTGALTLLHGDLHHDNVIAADKGDCAIDPKGTFGPRAFEFANAFRNPRGGGAFLTDPSRARRMADDISAITAIDASELLAFAAAKAALSIVWKLESEPAPQGWKDNLSMLLTVAAENPW